MNSDGDFLDAGETEDFLKLDTEAEDYPSSITADTSSQSLIVTPLMITLVGIIIQGINFSA